MNIMQLRAFPLLFSVVLVLIFSSCNKHAKPDLEKEKAMLLKKGMLIENTFLKIVAETDTLATYVTNLYVQQKKYNVQSDSSKYEEIDGGILYKPSNDGNAAVYVSGKVPVNEAIRNIVHFTSPVDSLLKKLVLELGPLVVQSYFCEQHSYFRFYPFLDVLGQFQPKMNILDYNIYYLADKENNPGRGPMIIDNPYVDPAGRGWIISSIAPVYSNNILEGVVGLDISVDALHNMFLSADESDIMLVDSSGIIIMMDDKKSGLFEMPSMKSNKYIETIRNNEYLGTDFNFLCSKNKNIRTAFTELLRNNKPYTTVTIDEDEYYLVAYKIEKLNWFLIKVISTNQNS